MRAPGLLGLKEQKGHRQVSGYALPIMCIIGLAMWFALKRAGMKKWPAFAVMWVSLIGLGALAQYVFWPGQY